MVNTIPYTGELENLKELLPLKYGRGISDPIYRSCQNLTMENCFISITLVETMLKEYNLIVVGGPWAMGSLCHNNKKEMPPFFLVSRPVEV